MSEVKPLVVFPLLECTPTMHALFDRSLYRNCSAQDPKSFAWDAQALVLPSRAANGCVCCIRWSTTRSRAGRMIEFFASNLRGKLFIPQKCITLLKSLGFNHLKLSIIHVNPLPPLSRRCKQKPPDCSVRMRSSPANSSCLGVQMRMLPNG